jgi:hypothetical protein
MPQYIDGTTLTNSTAVYTDAGLTTCAVSGFYSDGITVREQVTTGSSCVLLPGQVCTSCATDCDVAIAANTGSGVFNMSIEVGALTGAAVLMLNVQSFPDGVMATYDGQEYNKLSSPVYGLLQGGTAASLTYLGVTSACLAAGTYNNQANYIYVNGAWVQQGTQNVTVLANQIQTNVAQSGDSIMVIPKPNATPSTIQVQVVGLCPTTQWNTFLNCVEPLTGVSSHATASLTSSAACDTVHNTILYHVKVNSAGSPGNVMLRDYLFTDINGAAEAVDGWYPLPDGSTVEVTSGIVTDTADTCATWNLQDCLDASLHTVLQGSYGFVVGDVIQYETMVPATGPDGINRCGTIVTGGIGVTTNAVVAHAVTRACGDTAHCPS